MGHVLGYGTIWSDQGLLVDPVLSGGTDPHFSGAQAVSAFDSVGGASYPNGKVPVEDLGGPGTADAHWRESVFDNELMTGWLNQGSNPLSVVTIASMADLGYQVDFSAADAFSLQPALRAAPARPGVHLLNDIARRPLGVLGRDGQVVRYLHH
jgi:hypothetical protein